MSQYKNVVTILADPQKLRLTEPEMHSVVDILQASGAIIEHVEWLAEDEACDIFFTILTQGEVCKLLTQLFEQAELPFDFVVQNAFNRKKKLIISDMDSTMIQQECIDEIADFAGLKEKIAIITDRAMNGELDFKEALRERVGMLVGLSEDVLEKAFEQKIEMMPGAVELVKTMKANGARTVLVSGGFTYFTAKVAEIAGFEVDEANILEIVDGKLTGKVKEPILDSQAKLNALKFHAEDAGVNIADTFAIGDGANDLPMILACSEAGGLGVAYHAKNHVKAQTQHKIDNCTLKALLYVQGYKAGEITSS
jgi:phosphoserine phosphatase